MNISNNRAKAILRLYANDRFHYLLGEGYWLCAKIIQTYLLRVRSMLHY